MSFEYENYESFTQYVTRELKENYIFQVPDADTLKELNNNDFWYEVTHGVSEKDTDYYIRYYYDLFNFLKNDVFSYSNGYIIARHIQQNLGITSYKNKPPFTPLEELVDGDIPERERNTYATLCNHLAEKNGLPFNSKGTAFRVTSEHFKKFSMPKKEFLFNLAFAIALPYEELQKLFINSARESVNFRCAEDVIAYFALKSGYSWPQKKALSDKYTKQLGNCSHDEGHLVQGQTIDIRFNVDNFIMSEDEEGFIEYLISNNSLFKGCSLTAHKNFMTLLDFLKQYYNVKKYSDVIHIICKSFWFYTEDIPEDREKYKKLIGRKEAHQKFLDKLGCDYSKHLLTIDNYIKRIDGREEIRRKDIVMLKTISFIAQHEELSEETDLTDLVDEFIVEMNRTLIQCNFSPLSLASGFDRLCVLSVCAGDFGAIFSALIAVTIDVDSI